MSHNIYKDESFQTMHLKLMFKLNKWTFQYIDIVKFWAFFCTSLIYSLPPPQIALWELCRLIKIIKYPQNGFTLPDRGYGILMSPVQG